MGGGCVSRDVVGCLLGLVLNGIVLGIYDFMETALVGT